MQRIVLKISIALMLVMTPVASRAFFSDSTDDMRCDFFRFNHEPEELDECQKLVREAIFNPWWQKMEDLRISHNVHQSASSSSDERDPRSGRSAVSFALQVAKPEVLKYYADLGAINLQPLDIFHDGNPEMPYKKALHRDDGKHNNNPALHRIVCHLLDPNLVEQAVKLGMSVDIRNDRGLTPLEYLILKVGKNCKVPYRFQLCDDTYIGKCACMVDKLVNLGASTMVTHMRNGVTQKKIDAAIRVLRVYALSQASCRALDECVKELR